jgi:hypothetical protein
MDYLSIKKMQNDRIKKLLRNEPAHLKFILGKMKRTKGPHKIIIKGPKRKPRSKTMSRTRSKTGSKRPKSIFRGSKTRSKIGNSIFKFLKTSKSRSKIGNSIKISKGSKGSKKRSKTFNPLLTV